MDVASFTIHKHYRLDHDHHDIAIIHLKHPVTFNNHVMPACLPGKNEELKKGSKCYITGWLVFAYKNIKFAYCRTSKDGPKNSKSARFIEVSAFIKKFSSRIRDIMLLREVS